MSHVDNIIISLLVDPEDEDKVIDYLNSYRPKEAGFHSLDGEKTGGSQLLECSVFVGAFNYLDEDDFIDFLKGAKLILDHQDYENLQLIIKRQDDDRWSIINIASK